METLHVQMEVPLFGPAIEAALEGLVALNVERMARRRYPPLYATKIRYRREPRGQEDWQSADRVLAAGSGDCEDLAGYRAAELRIGGELAYAGVVPIADGKYHAVVYRGDGSIEDPSRVLIAKEAKTMKEKPKVTCRAVGDHYLGSIVIPMGGGHTLRAAELGFDPWGALTKAVSKVFDVVSNPAVSAMLPPQAAIAIQLVKKITDMSPAGLKKLISDERTSPAEKQLATKVLDAKYDAIKEAAHGGETGGVVGLPLSDVLRRATTRTREPRVISRTTSGTRTQTNPPPGVTPGTIDPTTGMMWDGLRWTVPPAQPGVPPVQPGYPQLPAPYPGMYPYPGAPMPPMYPYPAMPPMYPGAPMPPTMWPWPSEQAPQAPPMMTPDEAAAIMLWGQDAFASGSFPGYDEGGGEGYPYPYPYQPY